MADIPSYSERVELAHRYGIDQRSIRDEARARGSVRGRAGARAREALAYWEVSTGRHVLPGAMQAPELTPEEIAMCAAAHPPVDPVAYARMRDAIRRKSTR